MPGSDEDQSRPPLDLSRLRRQDGQEFARLVGHFEPAVTGLCQSMGLRGADIDDALAEAFAAVYRALPGFDGRSALRTWVHTIAARTVLRVRRRYPHAPAIPETDAPTPTPAQHAEATENAERLWAAVARLDPRQAMAVELYYRQGRLISEIAHILECPDGTVKTLLARARDRLRDMLQRDEVPR